MEGYQFARLETFSAQGAPRKGGSKTQVRKNGQRAWTAEEVLQEAERKRLASLHVEPGGPPIQILPGTVSSFEEVRAEHAKATAVTEPYMRVQKDGSRKKARRKLRADARSLYSSVVSLPTRTEEALADPVLRTQCVDLLETAMEHERKTLAKNGGVLLLGVIHWDEEHVHAHYLAIAPQTGRVDGLHPGRLAKDAFNEAHAAEKAGDPKAVGAGANRAYRAAMSQWQDAFYDQVFENAGLLRFGPKRHRLSRAEYQKAKALKAQQARDGKRSAALALQIAGQEDQIRKMLREAGSATVELSRKLIAFQNEKIDLLVRENEAASTKARAEEEITRGQAMTTSAAAKMAALTRGMRAIDGREIDYRPPTPDRNEGLEFGPKAPEEKAERKSLREAIRPAFDLLVDFARRTFGLRKREEAVAEAEKARRDAEEAQDVRAAELRRQASVISAATQKGGKVVPAPLQAIANGRAPAMDEVSFPGAWAFARGSDVGEVSKRLAETSNLDLRAAWQATRDASRLTDDDAPLRGRFDLAVKVIEVNAADRGFDLEIGRQDMAAARRPEIAALHTDQLEGPVERVIRRDRDRQRLRGD